MAAVRFAEERVAEERAKDAKLGEAIVVLGEAISEARRSDREAGRGDTRRRSERRGDRHNVGQPQ